ncbi:MAG: hypothetical protein NTY06_01295 [Candidatus Gottesmanbacteria bacterium]|nr:hypothetical protein [Candidatus Gottesmanbacteria bacterium]
MLNQEAIIEFQQLYKREYGITISREQAIEYGENLVGLVKVVYGKRLPRPFDTKKQTEYDNHGHN